MKTFLVIVSLILSLISSSYAEEGANHYLGVDGYKSLKKSANKMIISGAVTLGSATLVNYSAKKLAKLWLHGKLNSKIILRLLDKSFDLAVVGTAAGAGFVSAGVYGRIEIYLKDRGSDEEKKAYLKQYDKKRKLITASVTSIESINDPSFIKQVRLLSCQECTSDEQRVKKYVNMYKKSQLIASRLNSLFTNAKNGELSDIELGEKVIRDEEIQKSVREVLGENKSRINLEMLTQLTLEALIANKLKEQV